MKSTIDNNFELIQLDDAEITAFNKGVTFTYKGTEYSVTVFWDLHSGYEIWWDKGDEPQWALNWEGAESLGYILDSMAPAKGLDF